VGHMEQDTNKMVLPKEKPLSIKKMLSKLLKQQFLG